MKKSEATDTPYDQISEKQHKLLIDSLANKMKVFKEQCYQIIKQAEEERHQTRENIKR